MKTTLLAACLGLITAAEAMAQSKTPTAPQQDKKLLAVVTTNKPDANVVARTNRLTDKMAQQLRLNNYQTNKLRAINREKVARMAAIEREQAANPKKVDEDCKGVCEERDRELRSLLSTAQYSDYYESRSDFYSFDKQFLAQMRGETPASDAPQTQYAVPGQTIDIKNSEAVPVIRSRPKGRSK